MKKKEEVVVKSLYPWQEDHLVEPAILIQKRDRVKAFYALILAVICYSLFLVLIFFEIPQTYVLKNIPQTINPHLPPLKRNQPAPVRWAKPPTPPLPPLPSSTKLTQKTTSPKPPQAPPLIPKIIPQRPSSSQKSVLDPKKAGSLAGEKGAPLHTQEPAVSINASELATPSPKIPRKQRSAKDGWLRKDIPARKSLYQFNNTQELSDDQHPNQISENQESAARAWDQNFKTYLERRYGKSEQETDTNNGNGTGTSYAKGNAERLGNELFLNKLVYAICDTSHQRPLHISHQSISLHTIIVWITLTNKRTISEISFEKSSQYPFINRYIEELIKTTSMPQLPLDWHEETLTVPLRVRIEVAPQMKEITLVPAFT